MNMLYLCAKIMHEPFLRRCFELARLGAGHVSPNPMVGAVLVYEGRILGEGWHRRYGGAHAEVHCVEAVAPEDRALIPKSTLYCSLEPCFHYGKTPPCVDLVLRERIPRVVVSNVDPNPKVAGQSVQKMRAAGVEVTTGVLEAEGRWLNRTFFTWIGQSRPHIHLKWAESADGYIGRVGERTAISGPLALRYVHRLRSESDAILVGGQTALVDNPRLDVRHYPGRSPLRIAYDRRGMLPLGHHLLDDSLPTWILGPSRPGAWANTVFLDNPETWEPEALLPVLAEAKRASLLVEGGARLLRYFLERNLWDEITVLQNERRLNVKMPGSASIGHIEAFQGKPKLDVAALEETPFVAAPKIPLSAVLVETFTIGPDKITKFSK